MDSISFMQQETRKTRLAPTQEYVYSPACFDTRQEKQSEHMKEYGINSIYRAIKEVMSDAYETIETLRGEGEDLSLPLFSKRGTRLAQSGSDVLEIDLAGSTFKQFRAEYKDVSGLIQYTFGKKVQKGLWGALSYIRPCRSFAQKKVQDITRLQEHDRQQEEATGEMVSMGLGLIGKRRYVRERVSGNKRRYTMSGPDSLNHTGDYTTRHLRAYMRDIVFNFLMEKYDDWNGGSILPSQPVWIKIQGHSRGGVAASEGAMMIRQMILENYGEEFARMVKFDIVQYDPVPGADTFYQVAQEVDYQNGATDADAQGIFESDGVKYAALGDSAQTTVIYSMHSEHDILKFTPQVVKGVDRIIVTPFRHSAGLDETDVNPVINEEGQVTRDGHRQAFVDAQTQTAYRMGSLNDLDRGVYILDEYNTLIKIDSFGNFTQIMESLYEKVKGLGKFKFSQKSRHDAIARAVSYWFENNSGNSEQSSNE